MARTKTQSHTKGSGRPTLQTIADRLDISRATVSNAYGRPDQLNPKLRQKIFEIAKEIGYAGPDPAARNLRRGRSNTIGVLFTEALTFAFSDPAAVSLLRGISEICDIDGYSVLLLPTPPGINTPTASVLDAVVDGFIVYCMPVGDPRYQDLIDRALPTLIVDEPRSDTAAFVGIDDRSSARGVAEHLLNLGHRRFGVIADRLNADNFSGLADRTRQKEATFQVNADRLRGYADALEEAGLSWEHVPVMECFPISPATGARGAATLLDRPDRPTAIIATSDQLALGVLDASRDRAIDVPGSLSVAGFDDIDAAARSYPGLTTVRQPLLEKGRAAGRLLLGSWPEGKPPSVILPTQLIIRASTGPAPA